MMILLASYGATGGTRFSFCVVLMYNDSIYYNLQQLLSISASSPGRSDAAWSGQTPGLGLLWALVASNSWHRLDADPGPT